MLNSSKNFRFSMNLSLYSSKEYNVAALNVGVCKRRRSTAATARTGAVNAPSACGLYRRANWTAGASPCSAAGKDELRRRKSTRSSNASSERRWVSHRRAAESSRLKKGSTTDRIHNKHICRLRRPARMQPASSLCVVVVFDNKEHA